MKSDAYYRDLLVDVLDEVSPMMISPALSLARRAVDEQRGRSTSPEYWRELLVDVLGDLPRAPESMPIDAARNAVALALAERERSSSLEVAREREPSRFAERVADDALRLVAAREQQADAAKRWRAAAFWRGMVLAPLRDARDRLQDALELCPISVERQEIERALRDATMAVRDCENGIELAERQLEAISRERGRGLERTPGGAGREHDIGLEP